MAKLFETAGKMVLEDQEIPENVEVRIFRGTEPTMTTTDKELLGTFTGNTWEWIKTKEEKAARYYYVYQYENQQKIIAERVLSLQGTFNTRDLGGYKTSDGKIVKWGQVFRSDALNQLTDQDVQYFERLGLRTIVDFRGKNEIESAPDRAIPHAKHVYLNPNAEVAALATGSLVDDQEKIRKLVSIAESSEGGSYFSKRLNEMADQMRELVSTEIANRQYRNYLELLITDDATPLLEHCKGGKDRAGFAAILFLMALGVSKEVIVEDYLLTKQTMAERNKKRMAEYQVYTDHPLVLDYLAGLMDTKELYIEAAFAEMEKLGGYDRYLADVLGMTDETLSALKAKFLY